MSSGHAPVADGDASGPSDPLLSIVVPTHNAREVVLRCVESIYMNPPTGPFEVIVVDDASDDGSAEALVRAHPQIVLLRNERNERYARSTNRGLRAARGRYLYLLNNDTIMQPGTTDTLMRFLAGHPEVGVVGGKLLNEDGSIQWTVKALPSAATALFGARSILTKWFPGNRFSRRQLLHWQNEAEESFTAGYVSGASTMLRRAVLERVGYLDEAFFYLVDADHCKRVWEAGFEVRYLPSAAVLHLNHQGGTMIDSKHRFQSVRRAAPGSLPLLPQAHRPVALAPPARRGRARPPEPLRAVDCAVDVAGDRASPSDTPLAPAAFRRRQRETRMTIEVR